MSKHIFDKRKWSKMSIFEQMGNIGSEVGRALIAKRRGDSSSLEGAFFRGMDLLNATIEDLAAKKSRRFYEVMIARQQFCEVVLDDKEDPKLDDYFTQFAVAARMRQGR